jgi:effector-binding domain-containing protein
MPYEVTVKQVPPQHVAEVRRHTVVEELGTVVGEAFRTLRTSIGRAGAAPAGPPFIVYDRVDLPKHRAEIEVCVPVGYRYLGDDDVEVNEIPGAAVASTIHHGPYSEVGPAYEALNGWIRDHYLVIDGPPREVYLADPEETPDPADLATEIEFPVR